MTEPRSRLESLDGLEVASESVSLPKHALGRIDRRNLSEEIATLVREQILTGGFMAGEPMPLEALASQLSVSTMPVREALQKLTADGLVEASRGRGFRVAGFSREDLEDTYFMYAWLSGELAARATRRADPMLLTEVTMLHDRFCAAANSGDEASLEAINWAFHHAINVGGGSRRLAWILRNLLRVIPHRQHTMVPGWSKTSVSDHGLILRTIVSGDADGARAALIDHLDHTVTTLLAHLDEIGYWQHSKKNSDVDSPQVIEPLSTQ